MEYPFDITKAYCYKRESLMAGAFCKTETNPDNIVTHYTYVKTPPADEDGMADLGADIYFAGIKEGETTVTVTVFYPTCEPDICR